MAQPLSFRWDEDFVARVDEARGLISRSAFVRAAVEQAIADTEAFQARLADRHEREKPLYDRLKGKR